MDNINQPAFPVSIAIDDKMNRLMDSTEVGGGGFTKLEYAALYLAAPMIAARCDGRGIMQGELDRIKETAKIAATQILEYVNK